MSYVVEMLNIRKEFPGIVANDNITLTLEKGEIHALLGENGAGKSTLMGVLFGMYQPEKGIIKVHGKEVKITNPNVANRLGIGMAHQHFKLVENFTVTENIILGSEPLKGMVLDIDKAAKRIAELSKHYGLNVDPHAKIEDISVGMQQRVEIMKMLYREAEVLIFDEPTAVLTPNEIDELMKIMRNLIKEGKSIIIITHKLKEIKAVANRCTVIRRGKGIGTVNVAETSEASLAEMMVGRHVNFKVDKKESTPGEVVLKIDSVSAKSNRKVLGLKDFSLEVRKGEIVGIAGVEGNGQSELVESITGLRKVESGKILLNGEEITNIPIRQRIQKGVGHIPEDRQKRGLVLDYTLENNMVIEVYNKQPFSKYGLLNMPAIRKYAAKILENFDVRSGEGAISIARTLSGGNQQKAIIGRELELDPDLLIAVQPTRGLDVGSIEYIHKRLIEHRDNGKAVLLVSLELDEVLQLSDRIAIINNGELIGTVKASETNENEVGLMMAGVSKGEELMRNTIVSLIAVLLGLIAGGLLMLFIGSNPIEGYSYLLQGGLKNLERIGNTLATASPLVFTGLSVAFAFRTGLFNIGGSGQMLIGGLCATAVALTFDLSRPVLLLVMVLVGLLGGAAWAFIPGILKARFNVHEVVSTIMMNWVAYWTVYYVIPSYFKGEFLETESRKLPEAATLRAPFLTEMFQGSYVNLGLFLAVIAVIIVAFIINKTTLGFELKAVGFNRHAAEYAGMQVNRNIVLSMLISGALAGLGGVALYAGNASSMQIGILPSQGYDGIAVALLGANSPIGVFFAAVLFGLLYSGTGFMNAMTEIPPEIANTIIAIIIYFAATSVLIERLVSKNKKRRANMNESAVKKGES